MADFVASCGLQVSPAIELVLVLKQNEARIKLHILILLIMYSALFSDNMQLATRNIPAINISTKFCTTKRGDAAVVTFEREKDMGRP